MEQRLHAEQGGRQRPKIQSLLARHSEVDRDLSIAAELGLTLGQFDRLPRAEADLWVARHERKEATCSDCGRPVEECSDPTRTHYPFRRVCYVSMSLEAAGAAYDELHKDAPWHDGTFKSWRAERSESHPIHYTHGVKFGIADQDIAPWDQFATDANASPEKPSVEPS